VQLKCNGQKVDESKYRYVSVFLCLCPPMTLSSYVSVLLCLCPPMSLSSYVSVLLCLCPSLSLPSFISVVTAVTYFYPSMSYVSSVLLCFCLRNISSISSAFGSYLTYTRTLHFSWTGVFRSSAHFDCVW